MKSLWWSPPEVQHHHGLHGGRQQLWSFSLATLAGRGGAKSGEHLGFFPGFSLKPLEKMWEHTKKDHFVIHPIWLVVWLPSISFSHLYWVSNHPNWRTHIFQRGGPTSWAFPAFSLKPIHWKTNPLEKMWENFHVIHVICWASRNSLVFPSPFSRWKVGTRPFPVTPPRLPKARPVTVTVHRSSTAWGSWSRSCGATPPCWCCPKMGKPMGKSSMIHVVFSPILNQTLGNGHQRKIDGDDWGMVCSFTTWMGGWLSFLRW